jgi:4-hydroxy-tetrahydrodipicolinate synthase
MKAEYITPAITVFKEDGTPDFDGLKKLYDHLITGGISGILVLGSIGEFFAMSKEDKKDIIRFAVDVIKGRVKILIGTNSMIPGETVELSKYAVECGADGAVIIPPYYFTLTDDSIYEFYAEIAREVQGDIYIYNFPDRTGYDISPQVMLRLARDFKNIVGCKDTIPGVAHTREIIKIVKSEIPDFKVYSGFDDNFAYNILSGGDGCIGGLSNVIPGFFKEWMDAFGENNLLKISEMQQSVNKMMNIYDVGVPFVPYIKNAMKGMGIIDCDKVTFPLPQAKDEDSKKLMEILDVLDGK